MQVNHCVALKMWVVLRSVRNGSSRKPWGIKRTSRGKRGAKMENLPLPPEKFCQNLDKMLAFLSNFECFFLGGVVNCAVFIPTCRGNYWIEVR